MARPESRTGCRYSFAPCLSIPLTFALLFFAGCGGEPASTGPAVTEPDEASGRLATPQDVFDAEKLALVNDDREALFDLYSPIYQEALVSGVAFGAVSGAAVTGKEAEVKELFLKHGVTESQIPSNPFAVGGTSRKGMMDEMAKQQEVLLTAIKDKRAFFVDAIAWLEDIAPGGEQAEEQRKAEKEAQAASKLTDLKISGDTAVGNREITSGGTTRKVPAFFVRINGSWYLDQGNPASLGQPME